MGLWWQFKGSHFRLSKDLPCALRPRNKKQNAAQPSGGRVFKTERLASAMPWGGPSLGYLRNDKDKIYEWERLTGALFQALVAVWRSLDFILGVMWSQERVLTSNCHAICYLKITLAAVWRISCYKWKLGNFRRLLLYCPDERWWWLGLVL